jgi:phosphate transport system permease protein
MSYRRRLTGWMFWGFCGLSFILLVIPSVSIIVSTVRKAWPALGWNLFTHTTADQNVVGLQNAIEGTLILLLGVLILAGIVGVGAGIYLAEYAAGKPKSILRFFSEVLAGMPSIVIGYIGFVTMVVGFHWSFSLLAAVIALSVLVVPYVVKTTEVSLSQVPTTLREASASLGMPRYSSLGRILLPTALPGVVSGLIVALAISTGELAPLLYTAGPGFNESASFQLTHQQVPYLTNVIYTDYSLPGAHAQTASAAAAVVSLGILMILIIMGRIVSSRARKRTERMSL